MTHPLGLQASSSSNAAYEGAKTNQRLKPAQAMIDLAKKLPDLRQLDVDQPDYIPRLDVNKVEAALMDTRPELLVKKIQ